MFSLISYDSETGTARIATVQLPYTLILAFDDASPALHENNLLDPIQRSAEFRHHDFEAARNPEELD
ncbi:hypothetical protein HN873_036466 [Arachis hypogaea]